jgi:Zn-dependent metalloprotease
MRIRIIPATGAALELLRSCALVLTITGWASAQPLVKHAPEPIGQASQERLRGRVTFAQRQALAVYGPEVGITFGDAEVPTSLTGQLSRRVHSDDAVAEAQAALGLHGAAFRVGPEDAFTFSGFESEESGTPSVRMQQTYNGIAVIGAELVIHLSADYVTGIVGRFVPDLNVPTGALNLGTAAVSALSYARDLGYRNAQAGEPRTPVIFVDGSGAGHLAIPVQVTHEGPDGTLFADLLIDAQDSSGLMHTRLMDRQFTSTPAPIR